MFDEFNRRWPALGNLLGAYYHQDWDIHGSPRDVLNSFASDNPADFVLTAAAEARAFADSAPTDELATLMTSYGVGYAYWVDGWTSRGWLLHVAETLEREVGS